MQKCSFEYKNTVLDYLMIITLALLVFFLFFAFQSSSIFSFLSINETSSIGFALAVFLGFVASISTCFALLGAIVLSLGAFYCPIEKKIDKRNIFPHLFFHCGRLFFHAFLGGALGFIGSLFSFSLGFTGGLIILISIFMLYFGLRFLHILPPLFKGFRFFSSFQKSSLLKKRGGVISPFFLGGATFFLPCGFTQSVQLAAIASGSFWTGALIMLLFALGTTPVLFSMGVLSSFLSQRKDSFLRKLAGVLIVFFSIISLNSGLILAGSPLSLGFSSVLGEVKQSIYDNVQVIQMTVDGDFYPNEFHLQKDIPVRWEIDGVNIVGCTTEIIVPRLGIRQQLFYGSNLIEFTPTLKGIIPFSCWQGIVTGKFIVE